MALVAAEGAVREVEGDSRRKFCQSGSWSSTSYRQKTTLLAQHIAARLIGQPMSHPVKAPGSGNEDSDFFGSAAMQAVFLCIPSCELDGWDCLHASTLLLHRSRDARRAFERSYGEHGGHAGVRRNLNQQC